MILNETVAAIADAIREKTGKSELIAPVDFAEEIKGITAGGGESASTIEYLDVSGTSTETKSALIMYALQLKLTGESVVLGTQILPYGIYSRTPMPSVVTAISIDVTMPMTKYISNGQSDKQELTTLEEMGISAITGHLPRITKEEFYSLD